MPSSAAWLEARRRGAAAYPVLTVDWSARGLALGRGVYAPAKRLTPFGRITAITQPGGWREIPYGCDINETDVKVVETSVGISDPRGELKDLLDTYEPLGSAAQIDAAATGLVAADCEPLFRGIVSDWSRDGLWTVVELKTDDTLLRTPVPRARFLKSEWGGAGDSTIFGTALPLVLGIHDAFLLTGRGAVPCINIRYDDSGGYWWLVAANRMKTITRVAFDGVIQPSSIWSVVYGVWGGQLLTIISILPAYKPEKGVVVSCDCEGPDASGLGVGAALMNPVLQLRALLEEWALRSAPTGAWRGAHALLDNASWVAGAEYFSRHGHESAIRVGGDQNTDTAVGISRSFLESFRWARIWWTPLGTLAFSVVDPDEPERSSATWLDTKYCEGGRCQLEPGDRREVYTEISVSYLRTPLEQKYSCSYPAQDPAALPEPLSLAIENPWSQGRFNRE
jgi:hypothetical protein